MHTWLEVCKRELLNKDRAQPRVWDMAGKIKLMAWFSSAPWKHKAAMNHIYLEFWVFRHRTDYLLWLEMGLCRRCQGVVSLSFAAFDHFLIVKKGKCCSWHTLIFFLARWFLSTGSHRTPSGVPLTNNNLADEGCDKWTRLSQWPYPATDPHCGLWQVTSHLSWACLFAFW